MDTINLKKEKFPLREVEFDFGTRLISTVSLNEKITDVKGGYTSEEARMIDESFFYFVDDKSINLEEDFLRSKILSEI